MGSDGDSQAPTWSSVVVQTAGPQEAPNRSSTYIACDWAMDPKMVLSHSLGLEVNMALGVSAGHSNTLLSVITEPWTPTDSSCGGALVNITIVSGGSSGH